MEFLQEVIRNFRREDPVDEPTQNDMIDDLEQDIDPDSDDDLAFDDQAETDEFGDDPEMSDPADADPDADLFDDPSANDPIPGLSGDAPEGEGADLGMDGENDEENQDAALDDIASNVNEDPDRQGVIRAVPKAHLVYKRESSEGGYEELWVYNIGSMRDEIEIRRSILAGTDILPGKTSSEDGEQSYQLWASGNAEVLCIKGLPN